MILDNVSTILSIFIERFSRRRVSNYSAANRLLTMFMLVYRNIGPVGVL